MDDDITAVRTFFAQRHIVLNNEWEENVIRYIKLNIRKVDEEIESYNLPEVVFMQWLYSDLRESTRPSLNVPANANCITIVKPALLQLMSILDISESCYSQYRSKIVDLSKDDSEFHDPSETPREQEKTKHGTLAINKFCVQPKKKPMNMYEFSDGNIILKAVTGDTIFGLDSSTVLGAKILLIPKFVCRNRVVKLTSKNCQFLGGCIEHCMEDNFLKVICQKLNLSHEEAYLKASRSKKQLEQTMGIAKPQPLPPPTVVQPLPPPNMPKTTGPQPLQKKSDITVLQQLQQAPKKPQPTVIKTVMPQSKTNMSESTLHQLLPLQKKSEISVLQQLQPAPKKPEPTVIKPSLPQLKPDICESTLHQLLPLQKNVETNFVQPLQPAPKKPERVIVEQLPKSSLIKPQKEEGIVYISTFAFDDEKNTADITCKEKPDCASNQHSLDQSSFNLTDNFVSIPHLDNDISNYDGTLNSQRNAGKSNSLKPSSVQKSKQTILKPKVQTIPFSNRILKVDSDGFKRPLLSVRPSNNDNSLSAAENMEPPKKSIKLDNDGFKIPFPPQPRQPSVQRQDDFVPETPAAIYNAVKPSKSKAEVNVGPKELFKTLIASNSQRSSIFRNQLPFKTRPAVISVKKELESPLLPSLNEVPAKDTVNHPLRDFTNDNDVQMNDSHSDDDTYGSSSQPTEYPRKSFSEMLVMDSEEEFMEAIKANRSSQNRAPLRRETSIGRNLSAFPWKRLTDHTLPLDNSQTVNFSQPGGRIERKKNSLSTIVENYEEEMEEAPTQNPNLQKYDDLKFVIPKDRMKKMEILPKRQKIHPTHCKIGSELSVMEWSLVVTVSTETLTNVDMVVGKELLTSLLGFNSDHLKKAMSEKNEDELAKCREKAQKMQKIFDRHDLVFEVEFPPQPSSPPVIKQINVLASALDII